MFRAQPPVADPASQPARQAPHPWNFVRRTLTQFDSSKVSVARGLRDALGVAAPLIVGALVGRIEPALVVATGALNVGFADGTDPWQPRLRRLLAACVLVSMAVFCGSLSSWTLLSALATTALWSFGAGMLVCLGTQIGNMGVSSTCVLLIFASRPLDMREAALCGILALGGGLFQALLAIIPWPGGSDSPERLALASLYLSLARPGQLDGAPPATGKANAASEALAARAGDHSLATERYRALLDQAERSRTCLITLRALRARVSERDVSHVASLLDHFLAAAGRALEAVGETLRIGKPWSDQPSPIAETEHTLEQFRAVLSGREPDALIGDIQTQMDALARQLRVTFDLANNATPAGSLAFEHREAAIPRHLRAGGVLSTLRANLSLKSAAFRHAIRLSAGVIAADALGRMLGWYRPYWLPLTVTVVLKPDFSSTFSRGILRLAGTFAGLLLATILFHLLPQNIYVDIALVMAATFVIRWIGPAHYGLLALGVSELVVLLVAMAGVTPAAAILARARNTALGGLLALGIYWLWPTWERTQVAEILARMLDAYRNHLDLITRAFSAPSPQLYAAINRSRSGARLSRTNFEASVDRLFTEPGSTCQEHERWNSILAASYILAHSVISIHASLLADPDSLRSLGRNAAFQDFVCKVILAHESLAAVLRGGDPKSITFPDLRHAHYQLVHSGEPMAARHSLISVETDKMVNSLNTMREQILHAVR